MSPTSETALVGIIMGSKSDWETMRHADEMLTRFGVPHECRIVSAHRTPAWLTEFVAGAELIIHNAAFDCAFLDSELGLLDLKPINGHCAPIVDTLQMARDLHPGKRNSYQIDNSARTLHGALLDANLLAEVYLAMTRGQDSLIIEAAPTREAQAETRRASGELNLLVIVATAEELIEHEGQLAEIDQASHGVCLWKKLVAA